MSIIARALPAIHGPAASDAASIRDGLIGNRELTSRRADERFDLSSLRSAWTVIDGLRAARPSSRNSESRGHDTKASAGIASSSSPHFMPASASSTPLAAAPIMRALARAKALSSALMPRATSLIAATFGSWGWCFSINFA